MSLVKHWFRTSFHPLRSLWKDPGQIIERGLMNPRSFTIWGIRRNLEVIDMHRKYFLGGKAKKQMEILSEAVEHEVIPIVQEELEQKSFDWYFN